MLSSKKIAMGVMVVCTILFSSVYTSAMASATTNCSVDITISGLTDVDLGAFDIDMSYDSSMLTVTGYTLTDELGSVDNDEAVDWSYGDYEKNLYNLCLVSWLPTEALSSQPESFTLATIDFEATDASAIGDIFLSYVDLSDADAGPISFTVQGTDINAVPVPAAIWLMGSAFLSILGIRKRLES